jgi:hypothetical protein
MDAKDSNAKLYNSKQLELKFGQGPGKPILVGIGRSAKLAEAG